MAKKKSITKILIANRGEIASRIIITAKAMGIKTLAVYSSADALAVHTMIADESYPIGPPLAAMSYLNQDAIFEAAWVMGADAIHPGYGFLAENADFAAACAKKGLIFIGPSPRAIREMGSKALAKRLMEKAGVPVVPGYHGDTQGAKFLETQARKIGFPLLIKAVLGGGGKGMRLVTALKDFQDALGGARREAKAAFGNDQVLLEKYIETPRHIEVQVFGDAFGNAVHLFERDCSIQRRHQKVIEEAPAPGMTETLRARLTEAALNVAKAIKYENAGTVEFIVDAAGGLDDDTRFYFMEMNTRLQVEHPVTEMVTGLDLVEWQIRIARGEALPLQQKDIALDGHAIEARLYAEDPEAEFLPQTGTLHWYKFPDENATFRLEGGYGLGDEVSVYYDPMLAKLITWGATREDARLRMSEVIKASSVAGVKTNLAYLGALVGHKAFALGDVSTHFISDYEHSLTLSPPEAPEEMVLVAALGYLEDRRYAQGQFKKDRDEFSPWRTGGWRMNHDYAETLSFSYAGETWAVRAKPVGNTGIWELTPRGKDTVFGYLDETSYPVTKTILDFEGEKKTYSLDTYTVNDMVYVMAGGRTDEVRHLRPEEELAGEASGSGLVTSPMPGKILQVLAKSGANVKKEAVLIIMEAMKMEYTLRAPRDGKVSSLKIKAGDQVTEGQALLEIV